MMVKVAKNIANKFMAQAKKVGKKIGSHRDPIEEAKWRGILLSGAIMYQIQASFTKTTTDDKRAAKILQTLQNQSKWDDIADIIWGPEEEEE